MIRPFAAEIVLFLLPFAAYGLYLWATRAGVIHPASWPLPIIAALTATALMLVVCGFAALIYFSAKPPDARYEPAHLDGGRLIPGTVK